MAMRPKILIKGAGEHASGTAHRLFSCGYPVVMTEKPSPLAVRRTVSFCSAVFSNEITVEGVVARGHRLHESEILHGFEHSYIPVFVDPECTLRELWQPDVIVDARIAKRNIDNQISDAPVVIGLGPGLIAGEHVHRVVETNRGHNLGRIIERGAAAADTGIPFEVGGRTKERVLRAPVAGAVECRAAIGETVQPGQIIAEVAGVQVMTALGGVLRGLVYPGSLLEAGQKLGDIDPRGQREACDTISDKARTISGAVLELVMTLAGPPR